MRMMRVRNSDGLELGKEVVMSVRDGVLSPEVDNISGATNGLWLYFCGMFVFQNRLYPLSGRLGRKAFSLFSLSSQIGFVFLLPTADQLGIQLCLGLLGQ